MTDTCTLRLAVSVPRGRYCERATRPVCACPMCLARDGAYYCMAFRRRLTEDATGPIRDEECERFAR